MQVSQLSTLATGTFPLQNETKPTSNCTAIDSTDGKRTPPVDLLLWKVLIYHSFNEHDF
jgi:hypothetical protein